MLKVTQQVGFAIQSASRPTIVLNQAWGVYPGGGLQSRTLSINLGAPAPDRKVIVVISMCDGDARAFQGTPTLDGVPMTQLYSYGRSYGETFLVNGIPKNYYTRQPTGIWIASRPDAATTGTLYFTATGGNMDGHAVVSMSMYGAAQSLPAFIGTPGYNAFTIDWPGTVVLGVWFSWQAGTPVMPAPWSVLVNNLHVQGSVTVATLDMDAPFPVPSWTAPYEWGSFFAAWQA